MNELTDESEFPDSEDGFDMEPAPLPPVPVTPITGRDPEKQVLVPTAPVDPNAIAAPVTAPPVHPSQAATVVTDTAAVASLPDAELPDALVAPTPALDATPDAHTETAHTPETTEQPAQELLDDYTGEAGKSWAASVGLVFEDAPDVGTRAGMTERLGWNEKLSPLMQHPNRWVRITFDTPKKAEHAASSVRRNIQNGTLDRINDDHTWEVKCRRDKESEKGFMYVMYVIPTPDEIPANEPSDS